MAKPPRQAMTYSEMVEQLKAAGHLPEHLRASAMTKTGKMISELAEVIGPLIGELIAKHTAPLMKRIAELEARPVPKWSGAWKQGEVYHELAFVVDHGTCWIAKATTTQRPGASPDWQLACKSDRR